MLCLLVCMAVKLKAAQTGGRKQQKKDKPPDRSGGRMGAMDRILIVLGVFLLCFMPYTAADMARIRTTPATAATP